MTYTYHIEGLQKILSKEYDNNINLSLNDILSSFSRGYEIKAKKEILKSILLIYNIDYRNHDIFLDDQTFMQKKHIDDHLISFGLNNDNKENLWYDFLEVVEMEVMIYKKSL